MGVGVAGHMFCGPCKFKRRAGVLHDVQKYVHAEKVAREGGDPDAAFEVGTPQKVSKYTGSVGAGAASDGSGSSGNGGGSSGNDGGSSGNGSDIGSGIGATDDGDNNGETATVATSKTVKRGRAAR